MNLLDRKIYELLNPARYCTTPTTIKNRAGNTIFVTDSRLKTFPKELLYHFSNLIDVKTFDPYTEFAKEIGFITDFELISHRIPQYSVTKFLNNMGIIPNCLMLNFGIEGDSWAFRDIQDGAVDLASAVYNVFQNKSFYNEEGYSFKRALNHMIRVNECIINAETTAKRYHMDYDLSNCATGNWSIQILKTQSNLNRYAEKSEKTENLTREEINELYEIYIRNSSQRT